MLKYIPVYLQKNNYMETKEKTKKKIIDLPETTLMQLRLKANIEGESLKTYIENLLINSASQINPDEILNLFGKVPN